MSKIMQSVLNLLNRANTWLSAQIFSSNVTVGGWVWIKGINSAYTNLLTAATTTSTTAVLLGSSLAITPKFSGNVYIIAMVRGNNNTIGDGISIGLYEGASSGALTTVLDAESYVQEGLASNSHSFLFYYIVTGLTIGTAYYFSLSQNAVTGGTASAKIAGFSVEEV